MFEQLGMLVLARGGRLIQGLIDGDPVSWACLGIGVAIVVGTAIVKKKMRGGGGEQGQA